MALVALAILGLLVFSFGRIAIDRFQLSQESERLRDEIASLQDENRRLRDEVAELQSDAAVERLARERLGWTKPGETAIILVPNGATVDAAPELEPVPPPTSQPTWIRWRQLFFGR